MEIRGNETYAAVIKQDPNDVTKFTWDTSLPSRHRFCAICQKSKLSQTK